jgi:septal ring factor EnvC (AmiA/AmiB activator)
MTALLTKDSEIDTLDAFIAAQPADSYLRDILGGLRVAIVTAIRNDIGWIHFNPHEQEREKSQLQKQLAELRRDMAGTVKELEANRRELDRLQRERETLCETFSTISREACSAYAKVKAK